MHTNAESRLHLKAQLPSPQRYCPLPKFETKSYYALQMRSLAGSSGFILPLSTATHKSGPPVVFHIFAFAKRDQLTIEQLRAFSCHPFMGRSGIAH